MALVEVGLGGTHDAYVKFSVQEVNFVWDLVHNENDLIIKRLNKKFKIQGPNWKL